MSNLGFSWSRNQSAQPAQQASQSVPFNGSASTVGTNNLGASILGNSVLGNPQQSQLQQQQQAGQLQRSQIIPPAQQNGAYAAEAPSVLDQLQKVSEAWHPQSPNCVFQHYFYNKVPAEVAMSYQKPANEPQALYDEAIAKRPDASSIPVLATGFSDLAVRAQTQEAQVNVYRQRMHEINDKLVELTQRHDLNTCVKLAEMKARHVKLVHSTLKLAVKIQVLRSRGYVLRADEEILKKNLEYLNGQIDDPGVFGRINEIWAQLSVLRERTTSDDKSASDDKLLDWDRDEESLDKLAQVLQKQQTGILYLTNILEKDQVEADNVLKFQTA